MMRHIQFELADAQVQQLREVIDGLPLNRYAPLILSILPQLPLSGEMSVAEKVAESIARIGTQPPLEYRAPRQSEREAEELHQLQQARKLK